MELITLKVGIIWFIGGLGLWILDPRVSYSWKHIFAFAAIGIFLTGLLPTFPAFPMDITKIYALVGILICLYLSSYFSGTPQNSGKVYGNVLFLAVFMLLAVNTSSPDCFLFSLFAVFLVTVLITRLENMLDKGKNTYDRRNMGIAVLWLFGFSLIEIVYQTHTWTFFIWLILLIIHIENRWSRNNLPAPFVSLYAFIFLGVLSLQIAGPGMNYTGHYFYLPFHSVLLLLAGLALLVLSIKSRSISKGFLYLYLSQEIVLRVMMLPQIAGDAFQTIALVRIMAFLALIGLVVMMESTGYLALNRAMIKGLGRQRPQFFLGFIILIPVLVFSPLAYWGEGMRGSNLFIALFSFYGLYLFIRCIRLSFSEPEVDPRILRPSLSTWSYVVFTILLVTAIVVQKIINSQFGTY